VYVITNAAIPNSVKIGFSTKDPKIRARELNHSGIPQPYEVAFDALVANPRDVEQQVHRYLVSKHHGKEWFQCSVAEAVDAISQVLGPSGILHTEHGAIGKNQLPSPSPLKIAAIRRREKSTVLCWNCGAVIGDDRAAICARCGRKHPLHSLHQR
jgi:hypothetical protein